MDFYLGGPVHKGVVARRGGGETCDGLQTQKPIKILAWIVQKGKSELNSEKLSEKGGGAKERK